MARRVFPVQTYGCLAFVIGTVVVVAAARGCDRALECPGPLAYYRSLRCTPVYVNEGDCCAKRYDCDHLRSRSPSKCYVNDNVYEIGDRLKPEDADPCDYECTCSRGDDDVAKFICASVDCVVEPEIPAPGCYRRHDIGECCADTDLCPETPEQRATCIVDGVTFRDGEYFAVADQPELTCVCQPGYKGENVEPFCVKPKHSYCSPEFYGPGDVRHNCAPVYLTGEAPQINCTFNMRCQNDNDTVIVVNYDDLKSDEAPAEEDQCLFGDLKMHVGDELNQNTSFSSICVRCVCQVPPVPTCHRLPDDECVY